MTRRLWKLRLNQLIALGPGGLPRRWMAWGCAVLSFSWTVWAAGAPAAELENHASTPAMVHFPGLLQPRAPFLASTLQGVGPQELALVAHEGGLKTQEQAGTGSVTARLPLEKAQALNQTAVRQFEQGQAEAALATWQQAQQFYGKANDVEGVLGTQINQAQALQTIGLYRRARSLMEDIQSQLNQQPDSSVKALGYQSLGSILQATGYLADSEDMLQKSLEIGQRQGLNTSGTLMTLGNTRRAQQNILGAEQAYGAAIAAASTPLVRLEAQLNQLSLRVDTQQKAQAKALLPKIEQDLKAVSPSRRSVYARVNLAASLMNDAIPGQPLAKPREIANVLVTAAHQAREIEDARAESYALGELGTLYERTQQWSDASQLTRQALTLAQSSNASDITYRWQWQMGRITVEAEGGKQARRRLGRNNGMLTDAGRDRAIAFYRDAVATLGSIRGDLVATNPEIQFSFQESVEPVYREMVSLLIQPDSDSATLEEAQNAIEELQQAELENFFRSACLDVTKQKIDEIDRHAAVVYPILLPDRLEVLLSISGKPLTHHTIYQTQSDVESVLDEWLTTLSPVYSSREQRQLAGKLYDWLIRPTEEQLNENQIQTLVFVPDGTLRNLPMAALHDGKHYLVEKYQVALTPGLQLLESRALSSGQLQALSVGLTEARQGFAALPGVQQEIEQIQANVPSKVVLDRDFTTENLKGQLANSDYPIVHLATHGQFSSDPEKTFLLTWDSKIKVRDIRTLLKSRSTSQASPVELLVLSACQTAVGDRQAALGLAGLAIQSGARSTLATLWSVNDRSTSVLMTELYEQLSSREDVSRGESLRRAQLTLIQSKKYNHPFYWSPFVLVGNWL